MFFWIGATRQVLTLSPEESTEVSCFAAFSGPGVFELSKIRLKIIHPAELSHLSPNIQYMLTVLNQD